MYDFYMDGVMLPVAPPKLEMKSKGRNKTIDLINEGEVNLIKTTGLQEISFEMLLPNTKYPFARYADGYRNADYYLDKLEGLKLSGAPFQFIVSRAMPGGRQLFGTNIKVTLEDYTVKEDAKNGFDVSVSVSLKEYREYGTKTLILSIDQRPGSAGSDREASNAPAAGTAYTVQSGDSLWKIAARFYGKGSLYTRIYDANRGIIKNPGLIYPGQILAIP